MCQLCWWMSQLIETGSLRYCGVLLRRPQVSFAMARSDLGQCGRYPRPLEQQVTLEILVELKTLTCISRNWTVHINVLFRFKCSSWMHPLCLWGTVPSLCRNRIAWWQLFPDVSALAGWMHMLGAPVRGKCRLEETFGYLQSHLQQQAGPISKF